jgi:NAD-dependent SIR2 family protein deacetylase/uncharacterized membrane protein
VAADIPPEVADWLHDAATHPGGLAVLTGAGMSAESGIPTFRDAMTGLWSRFDPAELASEDGFRADPTRVWQWYAERRAGVLRAEPNAGHRALADWSRRHPGVLTLVTQNVDDLHQRAGNPDTLRLHGDILQDRWLGRCPHGRRCDPADALTGEPPQCRDCGNPVRPGVVWFGESLPAAALTSAQSRRRALPAAAGGGHLGRRVAGRWAGGTGAAGRCARGDRQPAAQRDRRRGRHLPAGHGRAGAAASARRAEVRRSRRVLAMSPVRFDRLDALRGLAIVWMAAYHFGFDLNHFGLLQPRQSPHSDALWVAHRTAILSLFLFCAGAGQAVALHAAQGWPRFWRRWAQVAACAVLVSAGSALVFPRSWIAFGVLHAMAVMLVAGRLLAPLRAGLWPLAGGLLLLPALWRHPLFDSPWLSWTGLVTHKPFTEDYVPMLPWFGVLLAGLAAGQWLLANRRTWLAAALPAPLRPLATLGRWSLSFYMLHQPVLFGLLLAWQALRGR